MQYLITFMYPLAAATCSADAPEQKWKACVKCNEKVWYNHVANDNMNNNVLEESFRGFTRHTQHNPLHTEFNSLNVNGWRGDIREWSAKQSIYLENYIVHRHFYCSPSLLHLPSWFSLLDFVYHLFLRLKTENSTYQEFKSYTRIILQ